MLEFAILGPLEVRVHGRAVTLGGGRQRAVLAVLVLHANQPVSAERLALALWGEDAPPNAVKSVQVYVARLRKALDDRDVLVTKPAGYCLRVRPGELDAERFERLVADGRDALAAGRSDDAAAALREALALWRGPPLAELASAPFAPTEIARLEEQRLAALEVRVEADLAAGRHAELVAELEHLSTEHPWRERLHVQLMLALYRSGRQAEALAAYRSAYRTLVEQIGVEPAPELSRLQEAILRQDPALTPNGPPVGLALGVPPVGPELAGLGVQRHARGEKRSLPLAPNATLGRERELVEVSALLRREDVRLLTLSGPGGVGKTRLALELAHRLAPEFVDGAWFVALAATARADNVAGAIAGTLGIVPAAGERLDEALMRDLADRHCLLVLDNLEHLVDVAPALADLLAAAGGVQLLVTSRRPLRLSGETVLALPPLEPAAAVLLFTERVRAAGHDLVAVTNEDDAVRQICERVEGLPLAIELAAARMAVLTPRALLRRLDKKFDALSSGPRDAPSRQRTLMATIDWSYELLAAQERVLLRRLAVFAGGCTLEAAQQVCTDDALIDDLAALVDHSLLRRTPRSGEMRFMLLETIREYATARLRESGEEDATRERHAGYFIALVERLEADLQSSRDAAVLDLLEVEHNNLRAVLDWAHQGGRSDLELRLTGVIYWFWFCRGHVREALERLDAALAAGPRHLAAAKALRGRTIARIWLGKLDEAEADAHELLALAEHADDPQLRVSGLSGVGLIAQVRGDYERAREMHEHAASLSRATGDRLSLCIALGNLADVALNERRFVDAASLSEEELDIARDLGNLERMMKTAGNLAAALLALGHVGEAVRWSAESLRGSQALGMKEDSGYALEGLGCAAAALGRNRDAARLLAAAETVLGSVDARLQPFEARRHEDVLAQIRADLRPELFSRVWTEGLTLTPDEAAALLLPRSASE